MKALIWIFAIGSAFTAITAITGYNEFSFGTSGASAEKATIADRTLNAIFCLLLTAGAHGIKKRKNYGWWVVNVFYLLAGVGFLANIRFGFDEGIGFLIWMIISQTGCALLTYYFWLKWWKPKSESYFGKKELVEQTD
jgi:hypothetical protein